MPKKARKRNPGDLVLATFIVPHEKWQEFQKMAKAEGRTASATLAAFIESYLAGDRPLEIEIATDLEAELMRNLDDRIEVAVEPKIASLGEKMNQLQDTVIELNKRLDKAEKAANQSNTHKSKKTRFIDVEVVPIQENIDKNPDSHIDNDDIDLDLDLDKNLDNFKGLTQKSLCEEFGINPINIVRNAKVRGLSSQEYLQQLTGWVYRRGKYYPPEA